MVDLRLTNPDADDGVDNAIYNAEDENDDKEFRPKAEICETVCAQAPRTPNDKWPSKTQLKDEVRCRKWVDLTEIHFVDLRQPKS